MHRCVKDGLAQYVDQIEPIRIATGSLYRHDNLCKKWRRFCKACNMPNPKRISLDVPHRWNSTYRMLKESYDIRNELCAFFINEQIGVQLYPSCWDDLVELMEILEVFTDATKQLS